MGNGENGTQNGVNWQNLACTSEVENVGLNYQLDSHKMKLFEFRQHSLHLRFCVGIACTFC
jgi:hypothetical protein